MSGTARAVVGVRGGRKHRTVIHRGLTCYRCGAKIRASRETRSFGALALQASHLYTFGLPISGAPRVSLDKNTRQPRWADCVKRAELRGLCTAQ